MGTCPDARLWAARGAARRLLGWLLCGAWPLLALWSAPAQAQSDPPPLEMLQERYVTQRWTTRDALPQNSVTSILQVKDGALWLGTFGGLARFDGRHFELYDPALTPGLYSSRPLSLLEDQEGRIWMATQEREIFWLHDGAATTCEACPEAPAHILAHAPGGGVLIGGEQGLWRWHEGRAQALGELRLVRALLPQGDRALVGAADGLWELQGDALRRLPLSDQLQASQELAALHRDAQGQLWLGTVAGDLYRLRGQELELVWRPPTPSTLYALTSTPSGDLWIATDAGLLLRRPEGAMARFEMGAQGEPSGARSLLYDREGSLWVGTNGSGLLQLRPREARLFTSRHGLPGMGTQVILGDAQGQLWISAGGQCAGLVKRTPQGSFEPVALTPPPTQSCVTAAAVAQQGGLWLGSQKTLYHLSPQGLPQEQPRPPESWSSDILALLQTQEGDLWLGTRRDGLWRRSGQGPWARVRDPESALGRRVTSLVEAPDGAIWVGTDRGVGRITPESFLVWDQRRGIPPVPIRDIHVDPRGVAWLASYGAGLLRLEGERITHYTTQQGLLDNSLSRILVDEPRQQLWFNSNRGVFRVQREVLEEFAQGHAPEIQSVGYESGEGNGGGQPAGWRDAQGVLWMPTIHGMVRIDPSEVSQNTAPPSTRVVQIEVNSQVAARPALGPLVVPPGRRDLRLRYTALTLLRPEQLRYRYRLEGYDHDWHEVGSSREAIYTNLPPGRYRFEVRASNSDGVWSDAGDRVELTLQAAWHERWWFPRALLVLLALLAWGGHRLRLRALQRQNNRDRIHQERYRKVFEAASNSLYILGPEHRIRECNGAARRLHGHAPASLLEVLTQDSLARAQPELQALLEARRDDLYREVEALGPGGQPVAALLYGVPFTEEGQRGALLSLVDLSEQRQMQAERRQLELQMDRARRLEAIGRLAGGLAHDFNNIMTAVSLEAQHLAEDPEPEVHEPAQAILESSQRAVALTRQLLTFSQGRSVQASVFDTREALRALKPTLTRLVGKQVELEMAIPPQPLWLHASAQQFEQVIFNLVLNASDAMPDGGPLRVRLEPWSRDGQPWLRLTVEDQGHGIDPEHQEKIFEPFFTTKAKGEGLGLSSVHGIVQQWSGEIWLESQAGQGTRIFIAAPAASSPEGDPADSQQSKQGTARASGQGILLCEHSEVILQTAARVLRKARHEVREARTLPQAHAALAQGFTPALLILDLTLTADNLEELEELLQRLPDARFLLLGSRAGSSVRELLSQERITLLPRPFTAQQLLGKVEQLQG